MTEEQGFLACGQQQLYCRLFRPSPAERAPTCALIIAEPFGEEKRCATRMLKRMARILAQHRIAALTCDFSGSGDSTGLSSEVTWQIWQQEFSSAVTFLRHQYPQTPLAFFGARAGALIAASVAAEHPCRAIILAEPILSGADFLQELEKRQRIKGLPLTERGGDQRNAAQIWAAGESAEFAGFVINATFAQQAEPADLLADLQRSPQSCPLLLLKFSGGKRFPSSWEPLCELCAHRPPSQAQLIADKPFWGQLEYYESDSVINPCLDFLTRLEPTPQEK